MRKLVIVESPNKIKTLEEILGPSYVVMASVGHITKIVDFLTDFYTKLEASIKKVDKICPDCGKNLVLRNGKFGPFIGCLGYPNCKHTEEVKK